MEFLKCATALRKHRDTSKFIFDFIDHEEFDVSLKSLYNNGAKIASWLIRRDLTMSTVAILGRLNKFSASAYYSCVLSGSTSFPLDTKEVALFYQMDRAEVEIVIVDLNVLYFDIDLTPFKNIRKVLTYGTNENLFLKCSCEVMKLEHVIDFSEDVTEFELKRVDDFEPKANKQQISTLSQTSGSTGPPKILLYKNQALTSTLSFPSNGMQKFLSVYGFRGIFEVIKMMMNIRISSVFNFNGFILYSILTNTVVISSKIKVRFTISAGDDMDKVMHLVNKHKIPIIQYYTPKFFELMACDTFQKTKDLSFVNCVNMGGAQMSAAMYDRIRNAFDERNRNKRFFFIKNTYGTTELGTVVWGNDPTDSEYILKNSVGRMTNTPGFKSRIEDENGNECAVDVPGEVVALSIVRMFNYLKNKNDGPATWFRTGDRGYFDKNGYLYLVGRIKDTISLRNAKKINSSLVENLLEKFDLVQEVAVVGIPNENGYDDIHAFLRSQTTLENIEKFIINNLPETYWPNLHLQKEILPRVPNGKFNKSAMLKKYNI